MRVGIGKDIGENICNIDEVGGGERYWGKHICFPPYLPWNIYEGYVFPNIPSTHMFSTKSPLEHI
jgi:hypothetical protein